MWTFPGKKLLFMGAKSPSGNEWNSNGSVEWNLLDEPVHCGVQSRIVDLNAIYRRYQALHYGDNARTDSCGSSPTTPRTPFTRSFAEAAMAHCSSL